MANVYVVAGIVLIAIVLLYILFNSTSSKSLDEVPPTVTAPPAAAAPTQTMPMPTKDAPSASGPHKVVELQNAAEAVEFLGKAEPGILLVYAPWCGHCKMMMNGFEAASNQTAVRFARVEGQKAQDFMREKQVRGFPTIFTVNARGEVGTWNKGRDTASLLQGAAELN